MNPIIEIQKLLLDESLDIVCNAQFKDSQLPSRIKTLKKLSTPKPDITVGFKFNDQKCRIGVDLLHDSNIVVCRPGLVYPCFTLEAKGLNSDSKAALQNEHNAAVMLRNLRRLREVASRDTSWIEEFDHRAVVLTATLT